MPKSVQILTILAIVVAFAAPLRCPVVDVRHSAQFLDEGVLLDLWAPDEQRPLIRSRQGQAALVNDEG
ncbi:MAG: hypothetical protein ACYDHD_08735 [Vulcanimicrobiaceae bacterium]